MIEEETDRARGFCFFTIKERARGEIIKSRAKESATGGTKTELKGKWHTTKMTTKTAMKRAIWRGENEPKVAMG